MKKILFLALFLFSTKALAQAFLPVDCGTIANLSEVLVEYDEKPFAIAETTRESNGRRANFTVFFFLNPKTGTWTVAEKVNENLYCIVSSGRNFFLVEKPI